MVNDMRRLIWIISMSMTMKTLEVVMKLLELGLQRDYDDDVFNQIWSDI